MDKRPLVTTLPEHHEIARRLPAEERLWWWMRLGKLLARRPEPSTFHRCLAVHIHNANRGSALR
jgi:hypothetical protein